MIEVVETKGECFVCGNEDILGNGLCQECWDSNKGDPFSKMEREVLTLVTKGYENIDIAERLFVAKNTVATYFYKISKKMHAPEGVNKRVWVAVKASQFLEGVGDA